MEASFPFIFPMVMSLNQVSKTSLVARSRSRGTAASQSESALTSLLLIACSTVFPHLWITFHRETCPHLSLHGKVIIPRQYTPHPQWRLPPSRLKMSVVSFNPHHTQAILIFLLRLFFFHPHFGTRVRGTLPCDDLVGMKDHFDQLGVPDRVFVGPRVIRQGI